MVLLYLEMINWPHMLLCKYASSNFMACYLSSIIVTVLRLKC